MAVIGSDFVFMEGHVVDGRTVAEGSCWEGG